MTPILTIRKDQLHALSAVRREHYVERMLPHLAAEYPGWWEELGADGARAFVARVVSIGEAGNVRGLTAVSTLVELMVEFGENFASSPDREWALGLLGHPTLPDRIKVEMLAERLRARSGGRRVIAIEAR